MKKPMLTLMLAAMIMPVAATPAIAQNHHNSRSEHQHDRQDRREDRREDRRDDRQDRRADRKDDRRDDRRVAARHRADHKQHAKYRKQQQRNWRQSRNYDWNRPEQRGGRYYANDYYRDGRYYKPMRVTRNTRIYRGNDDRYYCRRSDGTTGLIIGAALGGLLGNQIGRGDSNILATIIGGGAGALLGREIDRGQLRCR